MLDRDFLLELKEKLLIKAQDFRVEKGLEYELEAFVDEFLSQRIDDAIEDYLKKEIE